MISLRSAPSAAGWFSERDARLARDISAVVSFFSVKLGCLQYASVVTAC